MTRAPVHVRDATAADAPALVRFNQAMARESEDLALDVATLTAGVSRLLANPRDGFYLCAQTADASDAAPIGALMVTYEWSDWRNGRFWWIQSVYVAPAYRRRGIYRALHEAVRERARADADACGLRLYVERENNGAIATYRALGMTETHYRLYEETF